jgi:hypothetical protein
VSASLDRELVVAPLLLTSGCTWDIVNEPPRQWA